jgi:hypothetical protein
MRYRCRAEVDVKGFDTGTDREKPSAGIKPNLEQSDSPEKAG